MAGYYDPDGYWVNTDDSGVPTGYIGDPLNEQKGFGSGAGTDVVTDPSGIVVGTPGTIDLSSGLGGFLKNLLSGKGSTADYATTLAGLAGLYEYMNKDKAPTGWQGTLQKGTYTAPTASKDYYDAIMSRGYGQRAMGMSPFAGQGVYTPAASGSLPPTGGSTAAPSTATPTAQESQSAVNDQALRDDIKSAGAAQGGLMGYARGGKAMPPRYLRGETDGMEDKIPSNIDGVQPAKLSHGEFVIPADVVSHLGNGNSDAGAKVLYKMMDRVRQARTGNKKQGKQINPEKFTPGGIAGYAGGGAVAFQTGGATNPAGGPVSSVGGLSPWVGDYVAGPQGFLSKSWALGDKPYEAYQGPLTAGTSPIQQQAYQGLAALKTPTQFGAASQLASEAGKAAGQVSYTPTQFNTGLGPVGSVQSYMSPYQQGVIDIQAREARRQADIARQAQQSRMAQAGAYGGGRQAIMESELQRNLAQQIGDIQEKGLQSAYDRALQQRFQEAGLGMEAQRAGEQSRQFGANVGLQGIGQQLQAAQALGGLGQQQFGAELRGIESLMGAGREQQATEQAAIDAQMRQFQEAQKYPYAQLEFQRSMLQGLPVGTSTTSQATSGFSDLLGGIGGLLGLRESLKKAGG